MTSPNKIGSSGHLNTQVPYPVELSAKNNPGQLFTQVLFVSVGELSYAYVPGVQL